MAGGPVGGRGPNRVIEFAVDRGLFPANGVEGLPFSQEDWPNPSLRKQAGVFDASVSLLLTTLAVVALPFSQADWPNPQRKNTPQVENQQNRLTLGSVVVQPRQALSVPRFERNYRVDLDQQNRLVLAAPFNQLDWPLPRGRSALQTDGAPNLLVFTTVQGVPFKQTEWPNPQRSGAPQGGDPQNLLPLAPQAVQFRAPWSVPRFQNAVVLGEVQQNRIVLGAVVQGTPFSQIDWPNPRATLGARQENPQNLLPLAPAQAAPFAQNEWPNPRTALGARPENSQNLLPLAPVQAAPFKQTEWLNPQGRKVLQTDIPLNLLGNTLGLVITTEKPFKQTEWPNPGRKDIYQISGPPNLSTSTLAPVTPVQFRIPASVPRFQRPVALGEGSPNLLTTTLGGPGVSTDQPPVTWHVQQLPPVNRIALNQVQQGRVLFGGEVAQAPFSQKDWTNPLRARHPQHIGTEASGVAILTTPPPQVPYNQYDWPVPKGYKFPSSLLTFIDFVPINFIPPAPTNRRRLYMDVVSGRLFWQISEVAPGSPTLILPL